MKAFRDEAEVPDAVAAEADFLLAAAGARVTEAFISRAPRLRLIQVPGHGFDHVDLEAASRAGVPVATVASSGAEAGTVAEMALLLAGVAARRILDGDRMVKEGRWGQQEMLSLGVFELSGKTLGILGLGRIGRELARRARGFGMRLLYHDVVRPPREVEGELGVEWRSLEDLLAESDIVSLHLPLTEETRGIINERTIALMKPGAILVNTARGALLDSEAVARALREGRIRAAALDVFEEEPPSPRDPLIGLPQVVLSPHMAGVTAESTLRILRAALENCKRVASGQRPLDIVSETGH